MLKIAAVHRIPTLALHFAENTCPDPAALEQALASDPAISHVAVVHCETTTGIISPIKAYGEIVKKHNCVHFVDAMSSFGAYPIDLAGCHIDYLVSSANKFIEGVPSFSFVLALTKALKTIRGYTRTLSLDLLAQWEGIEGGGQFRFTPANSATPIASALVMWAAWMEAMFQP